MKSGHLKFLDGMRALCALFVVMHHAFLEIWPIDYAKSPAGITKLLIGWLAYGRFAVIAFIVISGFCLMLPVLNNHGTLKGGARRFFLRRARRILPPFYAAMAVSLLLIFTVAGRKTGTH